MLIFRGLGTVHDDRVLNPGTSSGGGSGGGKTPVTPALSALTCSKARALRASPAFKETCATSGFEASWCGENVAQVAKCDQQDRVAQAKEQARLNAQAELATREAEIAAQAALLAQQQAQAATAEEQARIAAAQQALEDERAQIAVQQDALMTQTQMFKRYAIYGGGALLGLGVLGLIVRAVRK